MGMMDIQDKEDIKIFVDEFYQVVRQDDLIGPIFNEKVGADNWPMHLEKMYSFWNTVLFGQDDYRGNPFSHHIGLGITKKHFDRWTKILVHAVSKYFKGPKANEALDRAEKMRVMFEHKLKDIDENPHKYPIM